MTDPVRVRILGIGMGPAHVTPEVAEALRSVDYVLAADKGADDGLLALRRAVVDAHAGSAVEIVQIADPPRDRSVELTTADYEGAVADWHDARAAAYADVLRERGGSAAFLVWGDPSLYDSTLRILEAIKTDAAEIEFTFDVIPGITAVQALTARHGIPLNEVAEPVLITTGRRLREDGLAGSAVVMLDADCSFQGCAPDTQIWWGAYLGTADELLLAGRVGEVGPRIVALRAEARARHGWIMDTYLLRAAAD